MKVWKCRYKIRGSAPQECPLYEWSNTKKDNERVCSSNYNACDAKAYILIPEGERPELEILDSNRIVEEFGRVNFTTLVAKTQLEADTEANEKFFEKWKGE